MRALRWRRPAIWLGLAVVALAGLALLGSRWVGGEARAAADRAAAAAADSHRGLLASELQKFRLLPLVLAEYPDVARALAGDDRAAATRLDVALELLAERTDAAALYAIDARGRAVSASNWRLPTSFVGQDYAFRRYYTEAMARGGAELFALGTVSGRPGLYLARRIDAGSGRGRRALGVIVVKVEFDRLEQDWAQTDGITVASDAQGVIVVTSVPGWRFHPTRALDPQTIAALRRSRQFGGFAGTPAFRLEGRDAVVRIGGRPLRYRVAVRPAPFAGGRLLHLAPLAPAMAAARAQALSWGLALLLAAVVAAGAVWRTGERRRAAVRARQALEGEVARRTAELRQSNERLRIESDERAEAERRFRAAREELAQANRLGSLGQITAGVAHEINQPLAAIRTFAENGTTLLDRGGSAGAREALTRIIALTERIGAITGELRAFARRRTPSRGAPTLGEAVAGTLLLIGDRARGIVVDAVPSALAAQRVSADRVRLEQILVNLLQNALDAVAGRPSPRVTIDAERAPDGTLVVRVADTGGGVDPALTDALFTPFASGKPEGLGLGLAIARDIAREFGGELALGRSAPDGAVFVLTLRSA